MNTALSTGLNIGISKGLESLGVSPEIAGFAGSLVAGAVIGGLKGNTPGPNNTTITQAQHIQSAVTQTVTLSQVGRLGLEIGLDPTFTNILGMAISTIQGMQIETPAGVDFNLAEAFSSLKPQLLSSLAQYGVEKIGTSIGLDPRMSTLIGMPIGTAIDAGIQNGNLFGEQTIKSIQEGIARGALSYGIDFAAKSITNNPLFQAFSSRMIAGAVEGMLQQGDVLKGVYGALKQCVLGAFGASPAQILTNITSFSVLVAEQGFESALSAHLSNIFNRQSLESIWRSGGLAAALAMPKDQISLPDGSTAYQATLSTGEGIIYNTSNEPIGFQRNGVMQIGQFGITSDGIFGQISGKSYGRLSNGQYYTADVVDGKIIKITALVNDINLKIESNNTVDGIRFDTNGQPSEVKITMDSISLNIANGILGQINFVIDMADATIEKITDLAQKYSAFLQEAYLKEPETKILSKDDMVVADMKLDWIGVWDTMIKDAGAALGLFWVPANVRWAKAIADAVPKIADLMKNSAYKFIFTPGVNSGVQSDEHPEYRTLEQIEVLKNSFAYTGKRIMYAHSAGTEAQMKAILQAKADGVELSQFLFVFDSPRVSREEFMKFIELAKINQDQVLVTTATGDYPHYPTDVFALSPVEMGMKMVLASLYDYQYTDNKYHYAFLEDDITIDINSNQKMLGHGAWIDGSIAGHEYIVVIDGKRYVRVKASKILSDFSEGIF